MDLFATKKHTGEKKPRERNERAQVAGLTPGRAHEILKAPWFSEKALIQTERGVYAFAVPARATKAHVAAAIKEIYKVAPRKIRIVNLPGKRVSMRSRAGHATRAKRRKAYVYLAAGDTIQFV